MGYNIRVKTAEFFLVHENFGPAMSALKDLVRKHASQGPGWRDLPCAAEALESAESGDLVQTLLDLRWEVLLSPSSPGEVPIRSRASSFRGKETAALAAAKTKGDIIGIYFIGENDWDDHLIFEALAPWVRPGSFIEIQGEDDLLWRWKFDGQKCSQIYPVISWPD